MIIAIVFIIYYAPNVLINVSTNIEINFHSSQIYIKRKIGYEHASNDNNGKDNE